MKTKRTCKVCGEPFLAIKVTQFFCKRRCFKKDYYLRVKSKMQEQKQNPTFPIKKCSFCEEINQLDFDPVETPQRFNTWACAFCGTTNKLIWEHKDNPNSYQIIKSILITISFSSAIPSTVQTFQTYRLPVLKPGIVGEKVVIMPCDRPDIMKLQRSNRKRIIFS